MKPDHRNTTLWASFLCLLCNLAPSSAASDTIQLEPVLVEMSRPEAILYLQDKGLSFDIRRSDVCALPDTVVATVPPITGDGILVSTGSTVTLVVTTKTGLSEVPNVVGLSYSEALAILRNACFGVEDHIYVPGLVIQGACHTEVFRFMREAGVQDVVRQTTPPALSQMPWASVVRVTRRANGRYVNASGNDAPICP